MAKSKELKVETPIVETKKSTETKRAEKKHVATAAAVKAEKEAPVKEVPVEKEQEKDVEAAIKKTAAKAKKAVKEKSPVVPEVFIQYQEQQADIANVVARVKEIYVSQKHRESSIKSLKVYIKPQDGLEGKGKVYYVINDKIQGDLDLF